MTNLYEETKELLEKEGSSIDQITKVCGDHFQIPVDNFLELAKATDYDSGHGSQKIADDLRVYFIKDGFETYMYRSEYDGGEWWDCSKIFNVPDKIVEVKSIGGGETMWENLAEINHIEIIESEK